MKEKLDFVLVKEHPS